MGPKNRHRHRQAVRRVGRLIQLGARRLLPAAVAAGAKVAQGPGLDLAFIVLLRTALLLVAPVHELKRVMLDLVLFTLYVYKLLVFALCYFLDAAFFATFYSQLLQLAGSSLLIWHWAQGFVNLSPLTPDAAVR